MSAPSLTTLLAILAAAALASAAATAGVLAVLKARQLLDVPNARSSHRRPTPRGGGLAFVPVILLGLLALDLAGLVRVDGQVLLAIVLVAAVSWADDLKSLPAFVRLGAQAAAVALLLWMVPGDELVFGGALPLIVDRGLAGFALLWFVNLYNFMDGIDGLAAGEAVMIMGGLAVVAAVAPDLGLGDAAAVLVAGAAIGFLVFNRPPAKLFMGDVGSVPLGLTIGWLLVEAATRGALAAALILPLYFVTDATLTLLRRLGRRARLADAHREHAYQRAVDRGASHGAVVAAVALLDGLLVGLACLSLATPWIAFALALALTLVFVALLANGRRGVAAAFSAELTTLRGRRGR